MAVKSIDAAKFVCERGEWRVTNLSLQKILYIAHMVHMGRTNTRLIRAPFEAWAYGPVIPSLYRKVKAFGDKPILDIFSSAEAIVGAEADTLAEACEHLLKKKPGELVAITHWPGGAWAKNYNSKIRGIVIPDSDILDEYKARTARK